MRTFAATISGRFHSTNRDSLLDVGFRLDLIRGEYDSAVAALRELAALRTGPSTLPQTRALNVQFAIVAAANARHSKGSESFETAFSFAFDSVLGSLDDRTAALVMNAVSVPPAALRGSLRRLINSARQRPTISLPDALRLLRAYQITTSYDALAPVVPSRVRADDERRYVIERDVRIPVGDGATNCAVVVRPRNASRLPALLEYTIYADTTGTFREARRAASNGYVSVTAFTRGKLCSDGPIIPYRTDGADAAAVIDWISKQPWSDGRVGMFSGSYEGFTQWAAVKHRPSALKTIVAGAPAGPGIDVPDEGNIVWNFIYPWPFYTTNNKTLDNDTYGDGARWNRLNRSWYLSGRAYRDLDQIDGTPNPIFDAWISHASYDAYWRALIPYRDEFARVTIPVLETAGYYYGGPGAALYYFTQHYEFNPRAEHYLVIGPWDHFGGQRGVVDALGDTATTLDDLEIDPVARISLTSDLRFQWFDYVFKGGPKPALLQNRVNYEVVGANQWKHAASIAAMSDTTLRLYVSGERTADGYQLTAAQPTASFRLGVRVDLADRTDVDRIPPGGRLVDHAIDTANAVALVTEPFASSVDVAGLFSGHLEVVTNKRDFDLSIQPYELTPDGEYRQLPPFQIRASYASDRTTRHLLTAGVRQALDFRFERLIAQRLHSGSRLVFLVGIIKNPGQQINYGSGKEVSVETVADAGAPLEIGLLPGSYVNVPVAAAGSR